MSKEIKRVGGIINDDDGKKWLPVLISNVALSQINKIILDDHVDSDDLKAKALRQTIHDDCLELFKAFN